MMSIKNIIKKIVLGFKKKIHKPIKQKTYEAWRNKGYIFNPIITFVIQSHNKSEHTNRIIQKLNLFPNSELIVIDDGSKMIHTIKMRKALQKANNFLLVANDLYELATYDRAIRMARGKYICLLQDDDDFLDFKWIKEAIRLFSEKSKLIILGGKDGINYIDYIKTKDGIIGKYESDGKTGSRKNLFKFDLYNLKSEIQNFMYVQCVNRAPMWLDRKLFLDNLEEFDITFAPYLHDDAELCLRAWIKGYKIGLYNANFIHGKEKGGMRIWNNELTERQSVVNSKKINVKYEDKFKFIQALVNEANSTLNIK